MILLLPFCLPNPVTKYQISCTIIWQHARKVVWEPNTPVHTGSAQYPYLYYPFGTVLIMDILVTTSHCPPHCSPATSWHCFTLQSLKLPSLMPCLYPGAKRFLYHDPPRHSSALHINGIVPLSELTRFYRNKERKYIIFINKCTRADLLKHC